MIIIFVIPFLYSFFSVLVDVRLGVLRKARVAWMTPGNPTLLILLLCVTANLVTLAVGASKSGSHWKEYIAAPSDTTTQVATLIADCKAAVTGAFWAGALCGSARSRWTVDRLSFLWKLLWGALTIALVWAPVVQYRALLPDQWADALKTPSADKPRLVRIVVVLVFSGIATVAVAFDLRALYIAAPEGSGPLARYRKMQKRKQLVREELRRQQADAACPQLGGGAEAVVSVASTEPFRIDLGRRQLAPALAADQFQFRFTDAQLGTDTDETGYTTTQPATMAVSSLLSGRRHKDQVQYLPMLRFKH